MRSIINTYSNDWWRSNGFIRSIDDLFYTNFFEINQERMRELPHYYHLEVPVPGMSKHDLTLHLDNGMLIIEGKRQYEGKDYGNQTKVITKYRRSVALPLEAAADQIKAKVKNGMLILKIFKQKQHDNIRTIPVSGDNNSFLTKNNIWSKNLVQNLKNSFRKLF